MQMGNAEHRQRLVDTLDRIAGAADEGALVEALRLTARRAVRADGISLMRREAAMVTYLCEDAIQPLWAGQRFVLRHCISGLAMLERRPILIPDIRIDPRVPQAAYAGTFVRSAAIVPIGTLAPHLAIGAYWRAPGLLDGDAVEMLTTIARAATERLARIENPMPAPALGQ